jgi:hypothetical protein
MIEIVVDGQKASVKASIATFTLGAFLGVAASRAGRKMYEVALSAGVEHALEWNISHDKSNSLKTFIRLVNELGYDVVLRKQDKS